MISTSLERRDFLEMLSSYLKYRYNALTKLWANLAFTTAIQHIIFALSTLYQRMLGLKTLAPNSIQFFSICTILLIIQTSVCTYQRGGLIQVARSCKSVIYVQRDCFCCEKSLMMMNCSECLCESYFSFMCAIKETRFCFLLLSC